MKINQTRKTKPTKTSDRKRVNKAFVEKSAAFRGYMTGNEKSTLATLSVKNVMQRVLNRAMADDVTLNFDGSQNEQLQKLMKQFVKDIDAVIAGK